MKKVVRGLSKKTALTKKMYKHLAYLVAAGIVLIAFSFAWLTEVSEAYVENFIAEFNPDEMFWFKFYETDYDVMDANHNNAVTLQERTDATWTQTNSIDIPTLFPGKYYAFKIEVVVYKPGDIDLVFNNVTSAAADALLSAVKMYALATEKLNGSESQYGLDTTTDMRALKANPAAIKAAGLTGGQVLTFYFDIYIPGNDPLIDYDDIRMNGAKIEIGGVSVEESP